MPHRDDSEAARMRIESLERELAQTKQRADEAEAEARAARAAVKPEPELSKRAKKREKTKQEKKRERATAAARKREPTSARAWPAEAVARYQWLVGIVAAVGYAPAAFLFVASVNALPLGALGAGLLVNLVGAYVIGRVCGAPYPSSGAFVLMIVASLIMMALFLASGDVLFGSFCAEGAARWIVHGGLAIATLALGGMISASWSSDAARSDIGTER